jgi:hypothetical protein
MERRDELIEKAKTELVSGLLNRMPIFIPLNMMEVAEFNARKKKTMYGYNTYILPHPKVVEAKEKSLNPPHAKVAKRAEIKERNFVLVYRLSLGIINIIKFNNGVLSYKVMNAYALTPKEERYLSEHLQMGLFASDLTLILYYLCNLGNDAAAAKRTLEGEIGRTLETLVETLQYGPGERGLQFLGDASNLGWIEKHSTPLVAQLSSVRFFNNQNSLYILTPVDYTAFDPECSSYYLLSSGAEKYFDSAKLLYKVAQWSPAALIQCYRLGNLVMNTKYTESVIKFIKTCDIEVLRNYPLNDLFLVGGVIPTKEVVSSLDDCFKELWVPDPTSELYQDVFYRMAVCFAFITASSSVDHCMINIDKRKAESNTFEYLLAVLRRKRNELSMDRISVEEYDRTVDFAFACAEMVMVHPFTRIHYNSIEAFDDFKYFIKINTMDPLSSKNLHIYSGRNNLVCRKFVPSTFSKEISKDRLELSAVNQPNSIVVTKAIRDRISGMYVPGNEVGHSVYIYYDDEGVVQRISQNFSVSTTSDIFDILDTEPLDAILKSELSTDGITEIKRIVTNGAEKDLIIEHVPARNSEMYISNINDRALLIMCKERRKPDPSTVLRASKIGGVSTVKDLNVAQKIPLIKHSSPETFNPITDTEQFKQLNERLKEYKRHLISSHSPSAVTDMSRIFNAIKGEYGVPRQELAEILHKSGSLSAGNIEATKVLLGTLDFRRLFAKPDYDKFAADFKRGFIDPKNRDTEELITIVGIKKLFGYDFDRALILLKTRGVPKQSKKGAPSTTPYSVGAILDVVRSFEKGAEAQDQHPIAPRGRHKLIMEEIYPDHLSREVMDRLFNEGYLSETRIDSTIDMCQRCASGKTFAEFLTTTDLKQLLIIRSMNMRYLETRDQSTELYAEMMSKFHRALRIPSMNKKFGESAIINALNASKTTEALVNISWAKFEAKCIEDKKQKDKKKKLRRIKTSSPPEDEPTAPASGLDKPDVPAFVLDKPTAPTSVLDKPVTPTSVLHKPVATTSGIVEPPATITVSLGSSEHVALIPGESVGSDVDGMSGEGLGVSLGMDSLDPYLGGDMDPVGPELRHDDGHLLDSVEKKIEELTAIQKVVQMELTNIIKFGIEFEKAIARFVGINTEVGPIEEMYGDSAQKRAIIKEKITLIFDKEILTVEDILKAYKIQIAPPGIMRYAGDFSTNTTVVPSVKMIEKYNPSFFMSEGVPTLIGPGYTPRFAMLKLKNQEYIVLAYAEYAMKTRIRTYKATIVYEDVVDQSIRGVSARLEGQHRNATTVIEYGESYESRFKKIMAVMYLLEKEVLEKATYSQTYSHGKMSSEDRATILRTLLSSMIADISTDIANSYGRGEFSQMED